VHVVGIGDVDGGHVTVWPDGMGQDRGHIPLPAGDLENAAPLRDAPMLHQLRTVPRLRQLPPAVERMPRHLLHSCSPPFIARSRNTVTSPVSQKRIRTSRGREPRTVESRTVLPHRTAERCLSLEQRHMPVSLRWRRAAKRRADLSTRAIPAEVACREGFV
jgi:hypothetical protein